MQDPRDLVGTWRLERVVEDRAAGERHLVGGTLELARDGEELRWEETLVWHRPDGDVDTRRGLRLVRAGTTWWVRFEDGRDFHPWSPGDRVVHLCGLDRYAGVVAGTPVRWTISWVVSGPAKDYTMTSVLTPYEP